MRALILCCCATVARTLRLLVLRRSRRSRSHRGAADASDAPDTPPQDARSAARCHNFPSHTRLAGANASAVSVRLYGRRRANARRDLVASAHLAMRALLRFLRPLHTCCTKPSAPLRRRPKRPSGEGLKKKISRLVKSDFLARQMALLLGSGTWSFFDEFLGGATCWARM